jgi:hypothetical protein
MRNAVVLWSDGRPSSYISLISTDGKTRSWLGYRFPGDRRIHSPSK